jgi:hypothetical protein
MSRHQFIDGHVYRDIEGAANYLATEFEGHLWLYQLVAPAVEPHWPFASCLLGFVCRMGETDWFLITCIDPGPPVKAKFDWVADFIERKHFEHVSDNAVDHRIDETARALLEQLDW